MMDYGHSLGIPTTGRVEGISDRNRPNQDGRQKKEKRQDQERKPLLNGHDEIVLSRAPHEQGFRASAGSTKEPGAPEDKGGFVDVKA